MKVHLTPRAERQLEALPASAARKLVRALRGLAAAPRSGRAYPDDSPFRGAFYKNVVVRARRWSYRLTYELRGDTLWVRFIHPSWYPLTHPDLASAGAPPDAPGGVTRRRRSSRS